MQQDTSTLTCAKLLEIAASRGVSDGTICNRAAAMGMKLSRTTLWRIRNGKLKGRSYLSTLLKLATVLGHE